MAAAVAAACEAFEISFPRDPVRSGIGVPGLIAPKRFPHQVAVPPGLIKLIIHLIKK